MKLLVVYKDRDIVGWGFKQDEKEVKLFSKRLQRYGLNVLIDEWVIKGEILPEELKHKKIINEYPFIPFTVAQYEMDNLMDYIQSLELHLGPTLNGLIMKLAYIDLKKRDGVISSFENMEMMVEDLTSESWLVNVNSYLDIEQILKGFMIGEPPTIV